MRKGNYQVRFMLLQNRKRNLSFLYTLILFFGVTFVGFAQNETVPDKPVVEGESAPSDADGIPVDEPTILKGAGVFTNNCSSCHRFDKEQSSGPKLLNAHKRWKLGNMKAFIKNAEKYIKEAGDEYAIGLYEKYGSYMQNNSALSDEEITAVIAYIKSESAAAEVAIAAGPVNVSENSAGTDTGGASDDYMTLILGVVAVVLVIILIVLLLIVAILKKYISDRGEVDEADEELINPRFDAMKILKSRGFVGIVVTVFAVIVLRALAIGTTDIGVQEGYAPKQPIAYSHKIHAGQFQIDCQYCHVGADKGKSANIPSANICMNCHAEIKTESPEIAKIYRAVGYNPDTKEYSGKERPIQWVRVHNLPDLAYFNHSQHVVLGKIECQTCHGPIEEMDVVRQHASLTMGWCIDCHRKTVVQAEGNEYYDKLIKIHNENGEGAMTVQDIGGLECSKCHY